MAANLPYDPYRVRHIAAHKYVVEQWAIGLEQDDAFSMDPLDLQLNPQQILGMVSLATSNRVMFKVLVISRDLSPNAEERAAAAGAYQGDFSAGYESRTFPKRIVEAAIAGVAPRGR